MRPTPIAAPFDWYNGHTKTETGDSMPKGPLERFRTLTVWKNSGRRAPNKPLLALWAIGRCLQGEPRLAPYTLVEKELGKLLKQFGPPRKTIHTEAPFWRMRGDGVWEIDHPELVRTTSKEDAYETDLRRHDIHGGLTEADYAAFRSDPSLARHVADELVAMHFPFTLHDEVLEATGIPERLGLSGEQGHDEDWVTGRRRRRDSHFRGRVLNAYGSRCAVCKFAGRIGGTPLALEAAHIKWHEAKGPDVVENGLSLCALHHDLFDSGAFTILPELKVIVADVIQGAGVTAALGRYHGEPLRAPPLEGFPQPDPKFLSWHRKEVFKVPQAAAA